MWYDGEGSNNGSFYNDIFWISFTQTFVDPVKEILNIPLRITMLKRNQALRALENPKTAEEEFGMTDQQTFHDMYELADLDFPSLASNANKSMLHIFFYSII